MKKFLTIFLALLLLLSPLTATNAYADSFSVAAKSSIAVDANSGKVLYSQNATDSSTRIASITKLLTAYLVYKSIDEKKISWDTKVPISDYAYNLTMNSNASNIPLAEGTEISVKDLLNALLLPSANSAAIALAEKIAGSEPKFVDMMMAQLKEWGITDAHLYSSSGLPNSELGENIYPGSNENDANTMSAQDVAIMCTHLIKDYPEILKITEKTELAFDKGGKSETTLSNTNQMLNGFTTTRAGVDGLKTGSTSFYVDCFAATTVQNGFRIITVVLESKDASEDNTTPFTLTNSLMNQVYASWTSAHIVDKEGAMDDLPSLPVQDGKKNSIDLVAGKDFSAVVPMKNGAADTSTISISFDKDPKTTVEAPIKKGEKLVQVTATQKDSLGYLPGFSGYQFPLIAKTNVERANVFTVMWNKFVRFVNEKL
ncbi:serine hydrolase [Lactococcus garvieae]|jgi:D-alanyl-D-alanine carboxypeptidase (penicillin-binding protein 5/6)|uniref:serine hydrolase n=1 Tax=Lactococcus garvieae TaxID=1363 RepID=UPI0009BDCA1C|nr:serine hydrolase [Lactococcus garvieae]QPS70817.1 D-alanyl-D-alanine carboxypeptidase [Lactococcus garvieae]